MKILVTGCDGYIASGVIDELLRRGCSVVGWGLGKTNKKSERYEEDEVNIFEAGVNEIRRTEADMLVHLAWRNGFKHNEASHITDLPYHYKFISNVIAAGIPRVAVMGTMHEVGYYEGSINQDTPCNPTTPYGVAKNALRQLFIPMCNNAEVSGLWMRGYYLVSSDGRGNSIFSKIARAARSGDKAFPFTMGRSKYDFLPYEDFCRQTVDFLLSNTVGIVNICSGQPVSLAEQVENFISENNFDIKLKYGAFPDRDYDSPAIWGEPSKIVRGIQ